MRKRLNILLLSPWSDDWDINLVVGSPENAVLINGFIKNGIRVHLLIPKEKGFTCSTMNNLFLHPIPRFWLPRFKLFAPIVQVIQYLVINVSFIFYGLKVSNLYSIDLIYGLSSLCSFAVYWLGRHFGKPTILKLMGAVTLYPIKKWNPIYCGLRVTEFIAYKLPYDKLLVLDDGTQGDKVAVYFNVPPNRFLFYPQAIDKRLINSPFPAGLKERLKFESKDYIILFASRLTPLKGPDITLKAMKFVIQKEPRANLLVVGDGPMREKLKTLAKKLGIQDYVRFVGSVRYMEMWKYYRIADVFLSTNTYSNLTLPTIEAMVSGVPVVTLDIRDTFRLVQNGVTGFLIPPGHPYRGIADAICALLKDEQLRKRIADNSKKFVLSHFPDWNKRIEMEISLIREIR